MVGRDGSRQAVARAVMGRYGRLLPDMAAHFSEDYAASVEPEAVRLRERGLLLPFLAFSFRPWPMWRLHVGAVPRPDGALSVGLHVGWDAREAFLPWLGDLGRVFSAPVQDREDVGEVQCNTHLFAGPDPEPDTAAGAIGLLCCLASAIARSAPPAG